ncbi:hypothetical protein EDB80DRAFT_842930, partial [Ilyonectria destructans]
MDPFNNLPAEIRLHICFWLRLRSKRAILPLIKASPTMLQQYITSKVYITKTSLAFDLDDEMIQDATRIIQFPSWKTTIVSSKIPSSYRLLWTAEQLPNPFKTEDHGLITQIDKLHSRLLLFIEDYLTKATAIFPPRQYLCLPDLSSTQGHLMFKNETVCPRFDAAHLTNQERRRLLRAFLRHELICKTNISSTYKESELDLGPLLRYGGQKFHHSELEAIGCVHEYLKSLYGAIVAQCGDFWLPDIPEGTLSARNTGLLYPDNLYVDAESYASDMRSRVSSSWARFGFDLVTSLIRTATSGGHGRDRLKLRFKNPPTTRWVRSYWPSYSCQHSECTYVNSEDIRHQEGSGMYQILSSRIVKRLDLQRVIYRQRAWVFLDDDRLYPSSGLAPHFPTSDEMMEQSTDTATNEEWFADPRRARARHRSQTFHQERCPSGNDEQKVNEPQESILGAESLIIRPGIGGVTEETYFADLPPFW